MTSSSRAQRNLVRSPHLAAAQATRERLCLSDRLASEAVHIRRPSSGSPDELDLWSAMTPSLGRRVADSSDERSPLLSNGHDGPEPGDRPTGWKFYLLLM